MTKYNLSIECADIAELGKVVALLSGTTALVAVAAVAAPAAAPVAGAAFTPAPAFTPAAPVIAPGAVELDSTGLPYDARIHADTKGQNKDGTWRGRRGVDDATIAAVTAELRARAPITVEQPQQAQQFAPAAAPSPAQVFSAAPPAAAFAPAAPPARDYVAEAAAAAAQDRPGEMPGIPAFLQAAPPAAPVVAQQPQPMPQQPAPTAPAPAAPGATFTFQQLMAAIAQGLKNKKIDNIYLGQLVAHFQLPGIPALSTTHAALMPQVVESLRLAGVIA